MPQHNPSFDEPKVPLSRREFVAAIAALSALTATGESVLAADKPRAVDAENKPMNADTPVKTPVANRAPLLPATIISTAG